VPLAAAKIQAGTRYGKKEALNNQLIVAPLRRLVCSRSSH